MTQTQKDGQRVIGYASRSLSETERRYSQAEKEALALVWACEKFHTDVYGISFELVTDHKPLEVIQGHSKVDNWGGMIFIYSCSAQLISFEIDCFYGV